MSACDIIVIAVISVAFLAVVGVIIYKKVTHKGGCCDCGSCPHACHCKEKGKEDKKQDA